MDFKLAPKQRLRCGMAEGRGQLRVSSWRVSGYSREQGAGSGEHVQLRVGGFRVGEFRVGRSGGIEAACCAKVSERGFAGFVGFMGWVVFRIGFPGSGNLVSFRIIAVKRL